jgi:hypothetical protein
VERRTPRPPAQASVIPRRRQSRGACFPPLHSSRVNPGARFLLRENNPYGKGAARVRDFTANSRFRLFRLPNQKCETVKQRGVFREFAQSTQFDGWQTQRPDGRLDLYLRSQRPFAGHQRRVRQTIRSYTGSRCQKGGARDSPDLWRYALEHSNEERTDCAKQSRVKSTSRLKNRGGTGPRSGIATLL